MEIIVAGYDCVSAVGSGMPEIRKAIAIGKTGLRRNDLDGSGLNTWIGRVDGIDDIELGPWQSRNNSLAQACLNLATIKSGIAQLKNTFAPHRIGLVMGSSTSSIDRTETAYANLGEDGQFKPEFHQANVYNPHGPGLFVAHQTGIDGPAMTINTACSSSAKVFATAARWMNCGLVDAVLVGGVDTLGLSVLHGFHSLQLVSDHPCRPFDQDRDGINLGEAAGFAILVPKEGNYQMQTDIPPIRLHGYGESSDAHHMSHPHPEGLGARLAMDQALDMAGLSPRDINYINLHGTASRANDEIEGKLVGEMFPSETLCSSTKGFTGHTLGAAGITESIFVMDAMVTDIAPANLNLDSLDSKLSLSIITQNQQGKFNHVMTNSFGFGGNNCSLLFSREFG